MLLSCFEMNDNSPPNVQCVTLIWSKNKTLMLTNLSCEADASGGKPGRHHGCFCRHPPAGGDQIAALLPWQQASGQPIDAGGRILAKTRALRRPSPTGRWVRGDREPSDKSTGCDWLEQNLPVKCKRHKWWEKTDKEPLYRFCESSEGFLI